MTNLPPSRTAERIIIRLPDGMRDRIALAAKANSRSMTAEVVARLEASFGMKDQEPLTKDFVQSLIADAIDDAVSKLMNDPDGMKVSQIVEETRKKR